MLAILIAALAVALASACAIALRWRGQLALARRALRALELGVEEAGGLEPVTALGAGDGDATTGLAGRRQLFVDFSRAIARNGRTGEPFSLLAFVVEGAELAPEEELQRIAREVAGALVSSLRTLDVVYRVGTGHFIALLPDADEQGGRLALQRASRALADSPISTAGMGVPMSFRAAAIAWTPSIRRLGELVDGLERKLGSPIRFAARAVSQDGIPTIPREARRPA